jgi:hypothetical protein
MSGFPTPDRSRIAGEISEPADRMTSLFAVMVSIVPSLSVTSKPRATAGPKVPVWLAHNVVG